MPACSAPSRLLVTGADGFVGRHLLRELRRGFPEATLVAAVHAPHDMPSLPDADRIVPFDLIDTSGLAALVIAQRPDGLVHLAAQTSVPASFADPLANWHANLIGTVALAEAVLRHAPTCRFVFASSAEIYGLSFRDALPLDESARLLPANPYAASKASCDLAIGEMVLRGLDAVRMRAFNHTGRGQSERFVVAALCRQIAMIETGLQPPMLRVGTLDRWRDFLDVRDVCAAYAAALRVACAPGEVFNISSGRPRRIGDILDSLLVRTTIRPGKQVDPVRIRPTDVERVVGDAMRARRLLGWQPLVPWETTLDDVLDDWRQRVGQASHPGGG